jgi:dephospho-CoA kinase
MARDGSERAAAQARVDAQLPISAKLPYADVVLDNSGGPPELQPAAALATLVFRAVKRRRRSRSRRRDGAARTGL